MYIRKKVVILILIARALNESGVKLAVMFLLVGILLPTAALNKSSFVLADGDEDCLKEFDIDDCVDQTGLILLDTRPPEITAPPDIKVVAEEAPVFVDIGKPKVMDLVDAIPVVANDAPKDLFFPFGTTVIKWKATDRNGNWAVDYQFVTVMKHPSPPLPFEPLTEPKKRLASLKLDPVPISMRGGEKVIVTGKLIDANSGVGIQGVHVNILDNRPLDKRMLGTSKTDDEGKFSFIWYTSPSERWKDRHMSIIAKFDGSPSYANTVSYDRSLIVEVERITLDLLYQKKNFGNGDRAIVVAAVKTFGDQLIEPDAIIAKLDGREVTLIKKTTGIYQFMSLPNIKGAHLFTVQASKLPQDDLPFGSAVKSVRIG